MLKTWIEISERAIRHNVAVLSKLSAPAKLIVPIKGNAYGHGLLEVASILDRAGVQWFAVDWWQDALELRKRGFKQSILLIGFVPKEHIKLLLAQGIVIDVYTRETLLEIVKRATKKHPARVHLEIETGFVRQGIAEKDLPWFLKTIRRAKHVKLDGVMTHFANVEDVQNQFYARQQLAAFEKTKKIIEEYKFDSIKYHTASSAAAMILGESRFDFVRTGIAVYGLWPAEATRQAMKRISPSFSLYPALTWKTVVAQVKRVKKGTPVSYGLTERVKKDSTVVVLPVGYFDGFDRAGMSRQAHVLIRGYRCKVLGRICMNMCMVDASSVAGVQVGDEVVLIGKQGKKEITAEEMAELAQTINYEIVTRLNPSTPRKIVR